MTFTTDWKFLVTLVATIAGVVVPVWLWRADISAKYLQIRTIARTPLDTQVSQSVSGLSISLDGAPLAAPYLTVIEITNTGTRPIQTVDFESNIDISAAKSSSIVRAEVTSTTPAGLKPIVTLKNGIASIQPLLLNPDDRLTLSLLTNIEVPKFAVRARISGISNLILEEIAKPTRFTANAKTKLTFSLLLLISYMIAMRAAVSSKPILIRKVPLYFISISSSIVGLVTAMDTFTGDMGLNLIKTLGAMIAMTFIAVIVAIALNRATRSAP